MMRLICYGGRIVGAVMVWNRCVDKNNAVTSLRWQRRQLLRIIGINYCICKSMLFIFILNKFTKDSKFFYILGFCCGFYQCFVLDDYDSRL